MKSKGVIIMSRRTLLLAAAACLALSASPVLAGEGSHGKRTGVEESHGRRKWVASWAASAHGPYPSGNAVAQPDLSYAFGSPDVGANEQTFRLIVRPDLWGKTFRLRFTNAFGVQPLALDDLYLGLQESGGAIVAGSNRPITFGGRGSVTIPPGEVLWSDPVQLEYVNDAAKFYLEGKKIAVSFHVVGTSGLMTWHAKAMQTSYVTVPGAGSHGADESDAVFPNSTTSWYFLDMLDVMAPGDTVVVAAFGDSITDGTGSTLNGDDRWPNAFSRRLHAAYGDHVSVVDEGIGGNRITLPSVYTPQTPFSGGPSALSRLERDVFSLSGITGVVWLEGINDFAGGATADQIIGGIQQGVQMMRAHGLKVVQATITSAKGNSSDPVFDAARDAGRKVVNDFIRSAGIFDSVADMDLAADDPVTGMIRAQYLVNSTTAAIDHIHPNRAGYLAMAETIDLSVFAPWK
jgi:lysophospholipase L1-like esterase